MEATPPGPAVTLRLDHDAHVNYAMQQNAVPVVKGLTLENRGDVDLADVTVEVGAEPGLAEPVRIGISRLPGGGSHRLDAVDLRFSPTRLVNQTEREAGEIVVRVLDGETTLAERRWPFEVLAYGEWAGSASLPEILAAFVQPNHPEIARLLVAARRRLEEEGIDARLSGYQSPGHARVIARAVYEAACGMAFGYVSPPASFERTGQKIRTPDEVVETRMGTCLDLVVFLAAGLEQAGLHPLLLLFEGHAALGVWLTEDCFVDTTIDDAARIRKRHGLDEILVLEATAMTSEPPLAFEEAVRAGARLLEDPGALAYAVDVRAARRERIRPLAARTASHAPVAFAAEPASPAPATVSKVTDAVDDRPEEAALEPSPEPVARLERWKRKLLDLSLRNRFLNVRDTKRTVPLLCADLSRLEDLLANGRELAIQPRPKLMDEDDPRDADLHRRQTGDDARREYLIEAADAGRIHADLTDAELEKRLVTIDREGRLHLEEGGAGALFLAVGFLHWFETDASDVVRRAPILLLPLEMKRDVVHSAFRVGHADDEPRINVTLLQKLETDYGIVIPELRTLESDGSGVDVPRILDHVRRAVLVSPRWDVVEEAALGLFSFTKHLMWHDLEEHAEQLLEHPVVRHLVEKPTEAYAPETAFTDPADLDRTLHPGSTYCPLDADSSQMSAIHAAADGKTFVLEGPPGTGKSQTIANLVAHSLACGRRVLFVSEKMAALEVVHDRLSRVGLAPFCLELHSNKARKRRVLDQLRVAREFAGDDGPEAWDVRTETLRTLRDELNAYVETLHRSRSFDRSAFDGIAALIGRRSTAEVRLDLGGVDDVDARRREALVGAVHRLGVHLEDVGPPAAHPWRGASIEEWVPDLPGRAEAAAASLEEAAATLEERASELATSLEFGDVPLTRAALDDLLELGRLLETSPHPDGAAVSEPIWEETRARIAAWIETGRRHTDLDGGLGAVYGPGLADLDLDVARAGLEAARRTFWPISWLKGRRARGALRSVLVEGKLRPDARLIGDLDDAIERRRLRAELIGAEAEARRLLGRHWRGTESDWEGLDVLLDWVGRFRALVVRAAGEDLDALARRRDRWTRLATEGRVLFEPGGALRRKLDGTREARAACDTAREAMRELVDLVEGVAYDGSGGESHARILRDRAAAWRTGTGRLRGWCAWVRARREALGVGLEPLVRAVEEGGVGVDDLEDVFDRSFHAWWVARLFETESLLRRFNGAEHADTIRRFRDLDVALTADVRKLVRGKLGERIPRATTELSGSSTSEMGILDRELMKKTRHKSIRNLFRLVPNVLCRLKPCMLMSPLSVAQYVSLEFPRFDLVVFDEASQIPVWDAIGAIGRGETLIVVGDSKQLPPTTFFQRADDEEFAEDDVEELESVLDECIATRLPRRHLGWHYRSRHESLIAFSNAQYYENRLLTFPSPANDPDRLGVEWRLVPGGIYDRGRARTNRAEAEAVVAEIVGRLTDPDRCDRSLGVVTFSTAQQTLIEDLLDRARREHPEIDPFFFRNGRNGRNGGNGDVDEPVFVKNLENVQGDERDVILFSVCYGPDASGRVTLNFGPINRDGGERRLNVAVTRARRQVVVFSSIRADQIDLARTNSVGVRHLKAYLEYAEKGVRALGQALVVNADARPESPFEADVLRALRERGWDTHPQVGCSGYRIDLGVKDPESPGRFVLGVECDGAMYHGGQTARDRDRLRASVLRSLGWRLHRIWSTDWWQDPDGETDRLVSAIEAALEAEAAPAPVAPEREGEEVPGAETDAESPLPPTEAAPAWPEYAATSLRRRRGAPESFYEPGTRDALVESIRLVLEQEAPLSLDLLARRVAAPWGLGRMTDRLLDRVREVIPGDEVRMTEGAFGPFLWRADQDPATHRECRVPGPDEAGRRAPEDLPPQEIAAAALRILRGHVSMSLTDLSRETARVFGFQRLGTRLTRTLEEGIRLLGETDGVRWEGETLTLP